MFATSWFELSTGSACLLSFIHYPIIFISSDTPVKKNYRLVSTATLHTYTECKLDLFRTQSD